MIGIDLGNDERHIRLHAEGTRIRDDCAARGSEAWFEIARDVAKKLIEAQSGAPLPSVAESFDYPVIIAT